MTFEEWTEATRAVLSQRDGRFLPTVADPATKSIQSLDGIPPGVRHTDALQDWLAELGLAQCYFAVAVLPTTVIVGQRDGPGARFAALTLENNEWRPALIAQPDWWRG